MKTIKCFALLISLFLAACTTPSAGGYTYLLTPVASPDVMVAQATYQAAVAAATSQAAIPTMTAQAVNAAATGVAGIATSQAASTADALSAQITTDAHNLQLTREANQIIAEGIVAVSVAHGTAEAINGLIEAEDMLAADEARRLEIQRLADEAAVERQRIWNSILPWLVAAAAISFIVVAGAIGYVVIRRFKTEVVKDNDDRPFLIIQNGSAFRLPAPSVQNAPVAPPAPPDEDLTPVMLPVLKSGHVLIAGETGAGKSTAMQAVLGRRNNVVVLDPHDTPGTWGSSATVIGGGRDFAAIGNFIEQTRGLLNSRYEARARGVTQFDPLTIATDEMPAIVQALGKGIGDVWREWLREGRKVGLFFVVSTQSTRVQTLGIKGEGDLLENFQYVLALGKVASSEYPDLVRGMTWPAVIRTAQGARPVIIPHEDEGANAAAYHEMPRQQELIEERPQSFTAPIPQPIVTEKWGTIEPLEIMNVLRMKRAGESGRAIERTVFGSEGGAAYYKVQTILDQYRSVLQLA